MLNVTDNAMEMCHATVLQLAGAPSCSKCLRFKQESGQQLALTFDEPKSGDKTIEHQGVTVFAVPERFVEICSGKTLGLDQNGKLTLS